MTACTSSCVPTYDTWSLSCLSCSKCVNQLGSSTPILLVVSTSMVYQSPWPENFAEGNSLRLISAYYIESLNLSKYILCLWKKPWRRLFSYFPTKLLSIFLIASFGSLTQKNPQPAIQASQNRLSSWSSCTKGQKERREWRMEPNNARWYHPDSFWIPGTRTMPFATSSTSFLQPRASRLWTGN